jgi:hypothetical protein
MRINIACLFVCGLVVLVQSQYCVDFTIAPQIPDVCRSFLVGEISLCCLPSLSKTNLRLVSFDTMQVYANISQDTVNAQIESRIRIVQLAPRDCALYPHLPTV